jgi:predicted metal-binding transcription factor (methanogenesis marker protein 9)
VVFSSSDSKTSVAKVELTSQDSTPCVKHLPDKHYKRQKSSVQEIMQQLAKDVVSHSKEVRNVVRISADTQNVDLAHASARQCMD